MSEDDDFSVLIMANKVILIQRLLLNFKSPGPEVAASQTHDIPKETVPLDDWHFKDRMRWSIKQTCLISIVEFC